MLGGALRSNLSYSRSFAQLISMGRKRAAAAEADKPAEESKRGRAAKAGSKPAAVEQKAGGKAMLQAAAADKQKAVTAAVAAAGTGLVAAPREGRSYFLMKSEPDVFSIDDLSNKPDKTEAWDGVRNHQAKKVLQSMRTGDLAFFYHSNAKPPGIVGVVEIVKEAYPDHTQWDPKSKYYDPSTSEDKPKWYMVDCKLVRKLRRLVSLDELKGHKDGALSGMHLFKYGRLSVQSVQPEEWEFVLGLEGEGEGGGEEEEQA